LAIYKKEKSFITPAPEFSIRVSIIDAHYVSFARVGKWEDTRSIFLWSFIVSSALLSSGDSSKVEQKRNGQKGFEPTTHF
jgi:hypothetical protein